MAASMTNLGEFTQEQVLDTTPERVFAILTDPAYVSEYAAGIEGAEIIARPDPDDIVGAKLEMVTKRGNIMLATITAAERPRSLTIVDERGTSSVWEIIPHGPGKVLLRNRLSGDLPEASLNQLHYDADVKFQALAKHFDGDDARPQDARSNPGALTS